MELLNKQATEIANSDDTDWADRSEYWRNANLKKSDRRKKYRYREPLILCGHGVRIRVDHDTLLIRNGFTHYPQKLEEIRFSPAIRICQTG